jgi:hypothetical protein
MASYHYGSCTFPPDLNRVELMVRVIHLIQEVYSSCKSSLVSQLVMDANEIVLLLSPPVCYPIQPVRERLTDRLPIQTP